MNRYTQIRTEVFLDSQNSLAKMQLWKLNETERSSEKKVLKIFEHSNFAAFGYGQLVLYN